MDQPDELLRQVAEHLYLHPLCLSLSAAGGALSELRRGRFRVQRIAERKSLEYINRVRRRCGLPDFEDSWALAAVFPQGQKLRKVLHQERSIEFLFEGRRFHDLRRWKEAPEVMNKQPRSWNRDAKTQDDFYQVIQAAQGGRVRVFESPKSYWLAIPLNQINKNPQLVQNPGY